MASCWIGILLFVLFIHKNSPPPINYVIGRGLFFCSISKIIIETRNIHFSTYYQYNKAVLKLIERWRKYENIRLCPCFKCRPKRG